MGTRRRGRVERLVARLPAAAAVGPRATILCYHGIDPGGGHHVSATPEVLGEHLDHLVQHADVVPLSALTERLIDTGRPVVAITFDDGYEDNHRHALPALAARGLPATFFVSSGFIDEADGTPQRMSTAWSATGPDLRAMSWSQVGELADTGMDIGGHTRSHHNLVGLSPSRVLADVADDRARIEDVLGRPVTSFAYPFGRPGHHLDRTTMDLVASCGYDRATTVSFQRVGSGTSSMALPRIPIHGDRPGLLAAKIAGRLDRLGRLKDRRALEPA